MSPAERRLWNVLKLSPDGFRFRKQHRFEEYTLDFFCPSRGLVVEVDGESHNRGDRPARDVAPDARVAALGYFTVRVPAWALLDNLDGVVAYIVAEAGKRPQFFET